MGEVRGQGASSPPAGTLGLPQGPSLQGEVQGSHGESGPSRHAGCTLPRAPSTLWSPCSPPGWHGQARWALGLGLPRVEQVPPQDGEGPCCSRESPEETCVFTSGKENFLPREEGWDRRAATGLSLLAGVTVEG